MRLGNTTALLGCLALLACGDAEEERAGGWVPLHVPVPEYDEASMSCVSSADGKPASSIYFDAQPFATTGDDALSLELAVVMSNTVAPTTTIVPLRFGWDCVSQTIGFQGDLDPMVPPGFLLEPPFCLPHMEAAADVVQAYGSTTGAGHLGLARFTVIPPSLGRAWQKFFEAAKQAQACCDDLEAQGGDCEEPLDSAAAMYDSCAVLQQNLDDLGVDRSIANVQMYRPYATSNGVLMHVSGFFEGVLPNGELITSSRLSLDINICAGDCGSGEATNHCEIE